MLHAADAGRGAEATTKDHGQPMLLAVLYSALHCIVAVQCLQGPAAGWGCHGHDEGCHGLRMCRVLESSSMMVLLRGMVAVSHDHCCWCCGTIIVGH